MMGVHQEQNRLLQLPLGLVFQNKSIMSLKQPQPVQMELLDSIFLELEEKKYLLHQLLKWDNELPFLISLLKLQTIESYYSAIKELLECV